MGEKDNGHGESNGQKPISVTPLQLLETILKVVLKDRITDEEIETICSNYYKTVRDWWGSTKAKAPEGAHAFGGDLLRGR